MEKKNYEAPQLLLEEICLTDVIAASGTINAHDDWSLDIDDFNKLWG